MKVLAVFTGGTIGSTREEGVISPDSQNARLLLEMYRNSGGNAAFETVEPYRILSENLSATYLEQLRSCIAERINGFDGVIVTHGTDSLQYTAAYLGYLFCDSDVPIVLVSANYPLADIRSNGLKNFTAAVDFIRSGVGKGVFVAYQNTGEPFARIHRATRLLPHLPYSDSVFSMADMPYGTVENGVFCCHPDYRAAADKTDFKNCKLSGQVLFLRPYVGIRYPDLSADTKAVLMEGWHSGTLPTDSEQLKAFCKKAQERKIPVLLTGSADGFEYESKRQYATMGIIPLPVASPIAMYMKLWLTDEIDKVFLPCGEDLIE